MGATIDRAMRAGAEALADWVRAVENQGVTIPAPRARVAPANAGAGAFRQHRGIDW